MIGGPRLLFALAAQGDLPRVLAAVNPVRQTPGVAIVVTAVLFWLLTTSGTFVYLATFSTLSRLLAYASTCAALIVLRRREGAAPVSIPFGPVCAVIALVCTALALVTTTGTAVRDLAIAMVLGFGARLAVKQWSKRALPAR
jgi:amino acid transporter